MSNRWKYPVALSLIIALISPVLCILKIRSVEADLPRVIDEHLHSREMRIVDKYRHKVNTIRKDMGLPTVEINSLEDIISAFAGALAGIDNGSSTEKKFLK